MPDKCLLLLLDEVRAKTLRILKSVPAEHARWAPPGLHNTILWHAGHAYVLVERGHHEIFETDAADSRRLVRDVQLGEPPEPGASRSLAPALRGHPPPRSPAQATGEAHR